MNAQAHPHTGPLDRAAQTLAELRAQGLDCRRLENDSRRVKKGDIFVAYPGARHDARNYIADAVNRGASGVLWEKRGFRFPAELGVPNLGVEALHAEAGYLAHLVNGSPSEHLRLIGITGTNGKTSCSHWIAAAFAGLKQSCALIGTLGNGFSGSLDPAVNTTPDAIALHAALADYRKAAASAVAMEVSSIGLDQHRCAGAHFDIAVLTNLSRDHLDYHGDMVNYAGAKKRLFMWPKLRVAVLNLDDPFGRSLATETTAATRIGYTLGEAEGVRVDQLVQAIGLRSELAGSAFDLKIGEQTCRVSVPVIGRHNVQNLLAVAATLCACDVSLEDIAGVLPTLVPPPGRLQMLRSPGQAADVPLVVIDYAHTPDALENVLVALRPIAQARGGQLICVFGCGGNRDRGKRPQMGSVAARHADRVWLTSDNPRDEEPLQIIADIVGGASGAAGVPGIEVDRRAAVLHAIQQAKSADVVLLAGKGHEQYQETAGVRQAYSDQSAAEEALEQCAADSAAKRGAR